VPVVYLLGGSAARESTINDSSWAAQVRHVGGPHVRTCNLGSSGQTYFQDISVVNHLPGVPSIVLIGVGLGRYVPQPVRAATRGGEQPTADPVGSTAQLELLIEACQTRGLHPVLLEMPLNLPIVRHALDKPRKRYRNSCRALAKKYGIPKINFLSKVGLVSGDFYDMSHLVEPGRVKWQLRLSKTVVSLLERYDMDSR
jgi:hypothetical protein